MKLHDLKPPKGSTKPRRRVGRGIAGKGGKTASRGMKGQRARGTVPVGFEGGQMPLARRVPKLKGFTNPNRVEFAVVNVDWLVGDPSGTPVRGPGTYRVGGEVAVRQQLSLSLRVGDGEPAHFDSGLVEGGGEFPRIDILISVNGQYCFDRVIDLHALPREPPREPF